MHYTSDRLTAKLTGIVEADETAIGGKASNMHKKVRRARKIGKGTGSTGKTKSVIRGCCRAAGNPHRSFARYAHQVDSGQRREKHVEPGSQLMTDELYAYKTLNDKYVHQFVNHTHRIREMAMFTPTDSKTFGRCSSDASKARIFSIEPFHMQAYLDSETFRFNHRELNDSGRYCHRRAGNDRQTIDLHRELIGEFEGDTMERAGI